MTHAEEQRRKNEYVALGEEEKERKKQHTKMNNDQKKWNTPGWFKEEEPTKSVCTVVQ